MAAAAAKRHLTQAEWQARALELAGARHLTGTARYIGQDTYRVPTTDRRDYYTVAVDEHADRPRCHCKAALHGRPCAHAGEVIHAERQRQQAISQPDTDVLAVWRRGGEW